MSAIRVVRPDGTALEIGSLFDQVYSLEDDDGTQYHWSVAEAKRRAYEHGSLWTVSLSEAGITPALIRRLYVGMDENYALTRDLMEPLIFLPFRGKSQLIDGWHRCFKAAVTNVDVLPAFVLTEEDAAACLLLTLPPGAGIPLI